MKSNNNSSEPIKSKTLWDYQRGTGAILLLPSMPWVRHPEERDLIRQEMKKRINEPLKKDND